MLTLDCEGRWGVADCIAARQRYDLTDERLHDAYTAIVRLLKEFDVPATFAFVGTFTQSSQDFARIRPEIERLRDLAPDYLNLALNDIDESHGSGWHGGHLVELVGGSSTGHEIALHGVTHVPWTWVDRSFAEAELELLDSLGGQVRDSRTFVYPRNLVAHVDVLRRRGFAGFRMARPKRSRAISLLSEFNPFEDPDCPISSDGIVPIPAGFFLNWRSGPRRLVPPTFTRLRAARLLDAARESGAIVHYWLHPENIASAPSTLALLASLVREVALRRDAGTCDVLRQIDYCRWAESLR